MSKLLPRSDKGNSSSNRSSKVLFKGSSLKDKEFSYSKESMKFNSNKSRLLFKGFSRIMLSKLSNKELPWISKYNNKDRSRNKEREFNR